MKTITTIQFIVLFSFLAISCQHNESEVTTPKIVTEDPLESSDTLGVISSGIKFNYYQTDCIKRKFEPKNNNSTIVINDNSSYKAFFNCNDKFLPEIDFSKQTLLIAKSDLRCYKSSSIKQNIIKDGDNYEWQIKYSRNEGCITIPPTLFTILYNGVISKEKIILSVEEIL